MDFFFFIFVRYKFKEQEKFEEAYWHTEVPLYSKFTEFKTFKRLSANIRLIFHVNEIFLVGYICTHNI